MFYAKFTQGVIQIGKYSNPFDTNLLSTLKPGYVPIELKTFIYIF